MQFYTERCLECEIYQTIYFFLKKKKNKANVSNRETRKPELIKSILNVLYAIMIPHPASLFNSHVLHV